MKKKLNFEQKFFKKKFKIPYKFDDMTTYNKINFLDSRIKNLEKELQRCQEIPKQEQFYKNLKYNISNDPFEGIKDEFNNKRIYNSELEGIRKEFNNKRKALSSISLTDVENIVKDDVKELLAILPAEDIIDSSEMVINDIQNDIVKKLELENNPIIKKDDISKDMIENLLIKNLNENLQLVPYKGNVQINPYKNNFVINNNQDSIEKKLFREALKEGNNQNNQVVKYNKKKFKNFYEGMSKDVFFKLSIDEIKNLMKIFEEFFKRNRTLKEYNKIVTFMNQQYEIIKNSYFENDNEQKEYIYQKFYKPLLEY